MRRNEMDPEDLEPTQSGNNERFIEKVKRKEQIPGKCTRCKPHDGENRGRRHKKPKTWRDER